MHISRREFLGYTAGAIGFAGLPLSQRSPGRGAHHIQAGKWLTLVTHDSESLRGYLSAIPQERMRSSPDDRDWLDRCSLLIVPHLLAPIAGPGLCRHLMLALNRGATVVIESGVGFADQRTFGEHRRLLRKELHVEIAAPVDLWADRSTSRAPYVEFTWPRRTRIRDFSRVVPSAEQPGEVIAWAGELPVAFRRRVSKGMLIYLGTPVGPALWAGDAEARRWLYSVGRAA